MNLDTISAHERRAITIWLTVSLVLVSTIIFFIALTSYRLSKKYNNAQQAHAKMLPQPVNSNKLCKKKSRIKEYRIAQQQLLTALDTLERTLPADVRITELTYAYKAPCVVVLEAQSKPALTHTLEHINSLYPLVIRSLKTTKPISAQVEITLSNAHKS